MPHAAAKQNGVPADSPCLRRTVQEPIRHSPELGIVPEVMKTGLIVETVRAFHAGFISDAFERQLCGQVRDRASIISG